MATATGTWSSVGSTDDNQCYCTEACSFTLSMCGSAVEAITNTPYDWSESEIDEMYNDCDVVHDGCMDECNGESGYDAFSSRKPKSSSNRSPKSKQREHHYTFDVDDNGLDINGFIVHSDKGQGKGHKFRVFLDSNENGRFDKKDELIGKTGLKQKHAAKGVGNLLDDDEVGLLKIKFKREKSNASMRDIGEKHHNLEDLPDTLDSSQPQLLSMSFSDPDGDPVSSFNPGEIATTMMDGGVRFINDSIDDDLFNHLVV